MDLQTDDCIRIEGILNEIAGIFSRNGTRLYRIDHGNRIGLRSEPDMFHEISVIMERSESARAEPIIVVKYGKSMLLEIDGRYRSFRHEVMLMHNVLRRTWSHQLTASPDLPETEFTRILNAYGVTREPMLTVSADTAFRVIHHIAKVADRRVHRT